jgi:hypothetical protein
MLAAPGVTGSESGNSATLDFAPQGGEVAPGIWLLNPSEIGPYGPSGAPSITASAGFDAITQAFDTSVSSSTGDLWSADNGITQGFSPVYLQPGASAVIPVTITPTAPAGTRVSGFVNLDDVFQANLLIGLADSGGDELASIPFSYKATGSGGG